MAIRFEARQNHIRKPSIEQALNVGEIVEEMKENMPFELGPLEIEGNQVGSINRIDIRKMCYLARFIPGGEIIDGYCPIFYQATGSVDLATYEETLEVLGQEVFKS
jgi:hypothetical protein